jgi:HNH endonuclease
VTLLDNVTCPYCGAPLSTTTAQKEHVVARRLVPKGKLNGEWNLLVAACESCNNKKSDLEDEVAAISMQPDAYGRFASDDSQLQTDAENKAKSSYSRRTKKLVKDSVEKVSVDLGNTGVLSAMLEFEGPAQLDRQRLYELCHYQVRAFFYLLTYDSTKKVGGFWRGCFSAVQYAPRSDWGNSRQRSFAKTTVEWEPRLITSTAIADGFYAIAIRRHPVSDCWSWAIEMNKAYRCLGFFGNQEVCERIADSLDQLTASSISQNNEGAFAIRRETRLSESEDVLFSYAGDGY